MGTRCLGYDTSCIIGARKEVQILKSPLQYLPKPKKGKVVRNSVRSLPGWTTCSLHFGASSIAEARVKALGLVGMADDASVKAALRGWTIRQVIVRDERFIALVAELEVLGVHLKEKGVPRSWRVSKEEASTLAAQ